MITSVGTDPELFVCDANKRIVSGIGLIGGSKEHPFPVKCGAVQEDNVLAEFNIEPANTVGEWLGNISTVTGELEKILGNQGFSLTYKSSHIFERDQLITAGPKAMEFGCEPDINCWTREFNEAPNPFTEMRTAGGHVHVGYDNPDVDRSFEVACILEYLLGVPSVLLDEDTDRRQMYGQAGSCRIKAYGVEYRVLSNFWLKSDKLKTWIFDMVQLVQNLTVEQIKVCAPPNQVCKVINRSDTKTAKRIINKLLANVDGFYMP